MMWGCLLALLCGWLILVAFVILCIHAIEHVVLNGAAFTVGLAIIGLFVFVVASRERD